MNKMSSMVRDLLDLSQLESGNFKVKMEEFEISALIENVISKFKLLYRENQIQFHITFDEEEYNVIGDEYRIEQVISNLIQNAVNHCKPYGNIEVKINGKGDSVLIEIFNEGDPIDEGDMPHIWESFYKTQAKKAGTGLGLAIVKGVLELHNSKFGVLNTPTGVSFFFQLDRTSKNFHMKGKS